jgi:hypothetical protein
MTRICLVLSLLATPALAYAQREVKCAQLKKKDPAARCKDMTIEGEDVDGRRAASDGQLVAGKAQVRWGSLIRIRVSMTDEVVKSAERLTR